MYSEGTSWAEVMPVALAIVELRQKASGRQAGSHP